MSRTKINVFLLGIAVAYLIIFVWQLLSPTLLSVDLYHTVAWVSFLLSFTEVAKSASHRYISHLVSKKQKLSHFFGIIRMYKKNPSVNALCTRILLETEPQMDKILKQLKHEKTADFISRIIIFIGYVTSMVALIILPFAGMSEGIEAQMMISVLTLITFVLLFTSIIVDDYFKNVLKDLIDELDIYVERVIDRLEEYEKEHEDVAPEPDDKPAAAERFE